MALPASENTTTARQGYVLFERKAGDDHIPWTNTGSAINQGDFVLATPYFGLADEDIAATSGVGTIHVGQVYRVGVAKTGSGQTFATWGQEVWYDPADGLFYEAGDTGRYIVGYVREVVASGVWAFEGLRFHSAVYSS
jgi:hypothetical protein